MVRNRAMYSPTTPYYWTLVTHTAIGDIAVDSAQPLNTSIPNSLNLTMQSGTGSVGAANNGFWGMNIAAGATYNLSFSCQGSPRLHGAVSGTTGKRRRNYNLCHCIVWRPDAKLAAISGTLVPNTTDTNAQLVLSISRPATVWLDVVSLFPAATFNNRTNGLRADLANMLATLHPSFMRCPRWQLY